MNRHVIFILSLAFLTLGCRKGEQKEEPEKPSGKVTSVMTITSDLCWEIETDKAIYAPGESVSFSSNGTPTEHTKVRYRAGSKVIRDEPLTEPNWTWKPPTVDGVGYLVEVYRQKNDSTQQIIGTIGVDVSSDWHLFPRYGFIATFDKSKTKAVITSETAFLNRCHINGVQFQDWHYKHHWPCPIKNGQILAEFTDIANRTNSSMVIRNYIETHHSYGMKSIFYNLAFGALDDAKADGVKEEWYIFQDQNHSQKDWHDLPDNWKSDIYLMDPGNTEWQNYIAERNEDVYKNFAFDGYQIDQLGNRGDRYTYSGQKINAPKAYASFIEAMKKRHPDKDLIMNAVSSFGSQHILETGKTMLAYNECWWDEAEFSSLYNVVKANMAYSKGAAQTVFAAYMNYECDRCDFNMPGVLLTDAVMFALGGSHLELGDHMLCREYFPYAGCTMSTSLKENIIRYYDFLTAYQNWLRGGGSEEKLTVSSLDSKATIIPWAPQKGKIVSFGRKQGNEHVIHLLNFLNADQLSWRDLKGTMPAPRLVKNLPIQVTLDETVHHVYIASPDYHGGALVELPFEQKNGQVSFTIPNLKYWDMIVFE